MSKASDLTQRLTEAEYYVYSPEEEKEGNVHRSSFDGEGIRNIAMSYIMDDSKKFYEFVKSLSDDIQHKLVECYHKAVEENMPKIQDQYDVLAELNAGEFVMKRHQTIINRTQRLFLDELNDDTINAFLQEQGDTVVEPKE